MSDPPQPLPALAPKVTDWLRPSVLALIAANAVPLLGVLGFGWKIFPLLLLFWFENWIIGAFNVLKMILASPDDRKGWAKKMFLVPFFSFHYGMFTLVHGVFVIGLFGGQFRSSAPFPGLTTVFQLIIEEHLAWGILGLTISHGISFGMNYLHEGEYRRASLDALMFQPYGRIVVLHLTVLSGGLLMTVLGSPWVGLLVLVILKIALDVSAHLKERRRFAVLGE
jgi:hypothetical protein